jgi:hypothetical protein
MSICIKLTIFTVVGPRRSRNIRSTLAPHCALGLGIREIERSYQLIEGTPGDENLTLTLFGTLTVLMSERLSLDLVVSSPQQRRIE